ncbi:hypothetical protein CN378_06985 [Bacillus sp. AFS015802]|uniref:hypothetical protein n=1 Tax=Bacillus sp. AFS015802 TaxID=2033486 RepID=UPI000BF66BF8|nr:hypothetical protein [Bacillus sp. AFS015802]PFA68335.1 hypothetical protein CN378_06985 [Bacillus sp. AFS015802]
MRSGEKSNDKRIEVPLKPEFTMNDRLRNPSGVYVPGESVEEHHAVEEGNGVIAEKVIGQANENG